MSRTSRLGRTATSVVQSGDMTTVMYHVTIVVAFSASRIVLNTGGWHTATTKLRMNQAAAQFGLGYQVFARKGEWYVVWQGKEIPFRDHMELSRLPSAEGGRA